MRLLCFPSVFVLFYSCLCWKTSSRKLSYWLPHSFRSGVFPIMSLSRSLQKNRRWHASNEWSWSFFGRIIWLRRVLVVGEWLLHSIFGAFRSFRKRNLRVFVFFVGALKNSFGRAFSKATLRCELRLNDFAHTMGIIWEHWWLHNVLNRGRMNEIESAADEDWSLLHVLKNNGNVCRAVRFGRWTAKKWFCFYSSCFL